MSVLLGAITVIVVLLLGMGLAATLGLCCKRRDPADDLVREVKRENRRRLLAFCRKPGERR